jgi:hypothetical protein
MTGAAFENRLAAVEEALVLFMALSTTPPDQYTPEELAGAQQRLAQVAGAIQGGIEMRNSRPQRAKYNLTDLESLNRAEAGYLD